MLDIQFIKDQPKLIKETIKKRGVKVDVDRLLMLDETRRELQGELESLRQQKNEVSKKIVGVDQSEKIKLIGEMQTVDSKEERLKNELEPVISEWQALMFDLPNLLQDDVPTGKDAGANEVVRVVGEPTEFNFDFKDYLTLAGENIDLTRAGKVSSARFYYTKGELALLQLALVRLGMEHLVNHGFTPVLPPVMVNGSTMKAMGYLEHGGEDETYHFAKDDLYLVGTSEQSVAPMHRDEILDVADLPRRYVAYSSCFRREAGSYGKDTKGIIRVHQFEKLEMVSVCEPAKSKDEHEKILGIQEEFMALLELPYRVLKLCSGDLGMPSAKTYDIETWMPSEGKYRETHSCSNTLDYQARRLNTRFKNKAKKNEFTHLLNGTVFAAGRILIALLENHQQKDGTVKIPTALRSYLGKDKIFGT